MSLTFYYHPLSSYCQKVLVALYETNTEFRPHLVDLADETARAALLKIWPIGKFPVVHDDNGDLTIPESSIIIEYLAQTHPGPAQLIPDDLAQARRVRGQDRFYDLYVSEPMQKIVGDRLRPEDRRDPHGIAEAKVRLQTAYAMIDNDMRTQTWAAGETFSMADCAAAPALFYANLVLPMNDAQSNLRAYYQRLMARPSFARVVEQAKPYFALFPKQQSGSAN